MVILRSAPAPVKPVSFCTCGDNCEFCQSCRAESGPADLILPCPDCGKRLWMHFDFTSGQEEFYCPDCTRWTLPACNGAVCQVCGEAMSDGERYLHNGCVAAVA